MKVGFRRAALLGVLFLMTYPPILRFGGTTIRFPIIVLGSLAIPTIWLFLTKRRMEKATAAILVGIFLGMVYLFFISALHGFHDVSMLSETLYGILIFCGALFMVRLYKGEYGSGYPTKLVFSLFLCGLFHSIIMMTTFLVPAFEQFLYTYVWLTEKGEGFIKFHTRSPGLTSGGGAALSAMQACTMICGLSVFPLRTGNLPIWKVLAFLLACLCIFVSIILSGRTGFLILAAWIPFHLLWYSWQGHFSKKTNFKTMAFLAAGIGGVAVFLAMQDFSQYMNVIKWAFEFYYTWRDKGELATHSTEIIKDMYFFPERLLDLIFGTSNFGRGAYFKYIRSDVGYVLFIFGGGILGTIASFAFYVVTGLYAWHENRFQKIAPILILFLCFMVALVNFKERFFILMQGWSQLFFIITAVLIQERSDRLLSLKSQVKVPVGLDGAQ